MMYYGGESNVPGAPGNVGGFIAGGKFNPLTDPRFTIRYGGSPYSEPVLPGDKSREQLDKEMFIIPIPDTKKPMAGTSNMTNALLSLGPNIIGNVAGMQSAELARNPINIPNIPGF